MRSNILRTAIVLSALLAFAAVWLTTGKADVTFTKTLVSVGSIAILLIVGFDNWAWRFWPFRLIFRRPILHGTWKVEQETDYEPRQGELIEAYLVIDQTFTGIRRVRGLYEGSSSHSLAADLAVDRSECTLSYIFRTEARTMNREGNPPSRGACILEVGRHPTLHLEGDYWLERKTKGHIRSLGHSKKLSGTFASAQADDYSTG
jgi:hypothetical protein